MFPETRRKTATRILAELMLAIVGAVPVRGFRQKHAAPVSNSALQESMHEYASIQLKTVSPPAIYALHHGSKQKLQISSEAPATACNGRRQARPAPCQQLRPEPPAQNRCCNAAVNWAACSSHGGARLLVGERSSRLH